MFKNAKNIKEDKFLTEIIGIKCFNLKRLNENINFEEKSFYSYIFSYSSKKINSCQKLGFKYVSSRVILKYEEKKTKDIEYTSKYKIFYKSKNLALNDFRDIIVALSKISRFYKDTIIRKYAKKIYSSWIFNSFFNKYADKFIIAKSGEKVIGFISLKIFGTDCIIDLVGIAAKYQNQGVGSYLLKNMISHFKHCNIFVGTEAENIKAVNFYLKNSFKIYQYKLVFHKHT